MIRLERQRNSLEIALAILTGAAAPQFGVTALGDAPKTLPAVPAALPSELLERRPDVAAAERQLAAASMAWSGRLPSLPETRGNDVHRYSFAEAKSRSVTPLQSPPGGLHMASKTLRAVGRENKRCNAESTSCSEKPAVPVTAGKATIARRSSRLR